MFKVYYNIMCASKKLRTNYLFNKERIFMLYPFKIMLSFLKRYVMIKKPLNTDNLKINDRENKRCFGMIQ